MRRFVFVMLTFYSLLLFSLLALRLVVVCLLVLLLLCHLPHLRLFLLLLVVRVLVSTVITVVAMDMWRHSAIGRKLRMLRLTILQRVLVVLVLEDLRGVLLVQTLEILMLLRRLAASTSSGADGSMTQPSAPTGSATASQSSALGPPSAPSPGTDPWYLDFLSYDSSLYSSFCFASFLSPLHCSYRRWFPSFCCWTRHTLF
jgi:hypothetical protein